MNVHKVALWLLAASVAGPLHADNARFDLAGPRIDVRVTRGNATLPIAEVPNLQPGDKIWVKADLPATQSNHLLLIVAFLRGTTNEPPDNWFTEIDTWDKKTAEGTIVTVPKEAEQALLFVAPETGGDFKTLRSAVKGRPGLFIRADTDLNEASFEEQRIERYLAAMKSVPADDPKAIEEHSAKLATTLALKPNADCFKQPVDQQVDCLTQTSAPVLLDDGHGQSIAESLSSGPSSDFINSASYTQAAGAGVYSAYVGSIVDLVHLVTLLRTAQYQYIPGISFPQEATLDLKLNAPPSFHNPKSVIVIGLPAIQKAKLPPLRPNDPNEVACLLQPKMTLPLQGAPLVFSTGFAHDLVLHLNRTGAPTDLPLKPDAFEGGLVVAQEDKREALQELKPRYSAASSGEGSAKSEGSAKGEGFAKGEGKIGAAGDLTITGTIRGYWGFDAFEGPTLTLQQIAGKGWKIVGDTQLLAGEENHFSLKSDGAACVQHVALVNTKEAKDKDIDVAFKAAAGKDAKDTLALDASLKKAQPGEYTLVLQQYGASSQDKVPFTAYTGEVHLDGVRIHAGDSAAVILGQGLNEVASVQIGNQTFTPIGGSKDDKALHLHAHAGVSPNDGSEASVKLNDGRTMTTRISAQAARPGLNLLAFKATAVQQEGSLSVTLGAKDDIPLNGKLVFVVQTKDVFPRTQTIEVATADQSVHTSLSLAANNLVLQDQHTAVATLDPLKAFGQSAFGKLAMRPVTEDGTSGDWTALGTLVRTPQILAIHCGPGDAPTCTADGNNFYLIQSFCASKDFAKPVEVPTGFAESSLTVPAPVDGATLYLKLRDDPDAVAMIALPTPIQKPATPAAGTAQSPAAQAQPIKPATSEATPATPSIAAAQPK